MITRDELISFVNSAIGQDLFDKAEHVDFAANGVQFTGNESVEVVTLGVSLNEEFLTKAIDSKSNFCIFHHGFDPGHYKFRYSRSTQRRLELIIKNNMTIMGLHYVLDAHPKLGNNAQIIKALGAEIGEPFYDDWGFTARYAEPFSLVEFVNRCKDRIQKDLHFFQGSSQSITNFAVVSGAGKPDDKHLLTMEQAGIDAFISGETSEWHPHRMMESGIHYIVAGHYATEVFGVKALGEEIEKEFGDRVKVEFIDVYNPI